ncbi:MAG: glycosyltransferase family 2 protein [Planctomycetota bacterium]
MSGSRVAVVVLNWNGLEDTLEAVQSLLQQGHAPLDVHVVDNASDNAEADAIEQRFGDRVTLYRNRENLGFTGGNHTAMRAALADPQVEFVALLNNDANADPDWISQLVRCAEQDQRIGVVASLMVFHDVPDVIENTGVELLRSGEGMPRDRGRPAAVAADSGERPIGACGGAVLYRATMLREIGLFEEDFFANFEDVELSLRALATGWDVRYAPAARVRHKLSRSIRKVRDDAFLLRSQRNLLWANYTRLPWQALLLNLPSILCGHLALLLLAPLVGQRRMARVIWRSRREFWRDRRAVFAERRRFAALRTGNWARIWWRQSSFVPRYVRSFLDVVVRRRRRFFE